MFCIYKKWQPTICLYPQSRSDNIFGQWLWLSLQSGRSWFESSHRRILNEHLFISNCIEKMKIRKMPGMAHLKKRIFYFGQPWPNWSNLQSVWPDDRIKSSPIFPKTCPKSSHSSFYMKLTPFRIAQKVSKYFYIQILHQELWKIAQSGPTVYNSQFICTI